MLSGSNTKNASNTSNASSSSFSYDDLLEDSSYVSIESSQEAVEQQPSPMESSLVYPVLDNNLDGGQERYGDTVYEIDLDKLTRGQDADLIFDYLTRIGFSVGYVLPAGEHKCARVWGSVYARFKTNHPLRIEDDFAASDLQKPEYEALLQGIYHEVCTQRVVEPKIIFYKTTDADGNAAYVVRKMPQAFYAANKHMINGTERVYVTNEQIGEGAFGTVKATVGTIKKVRFDGAIKFQPKQARVSKVMQPNDKVVELAERENRMMTRAGFFGNRLTVINDKGIRANTVILSEYRFPGITLKEMLKHDRLARKAKQAGKKYDSNDILSLADRFQLSIAILRELSRKIHVNNIKHLDIKPSNIIVQKHASGLCWNVRMIDLGLSELRDQEVRKTGTPQYLSPEFMWKLTTSSDVYSAGLVVGLVFGDEEWHSRGGSKRKYRTIRTFLQNLVDEKNRRLDLFHGINITDALKEPISKLIHNMIAYQPDDRISLERSITQMCAIFAVYLSGDPDYAESDFYQAAHELDRFFFRSRHFNIFDDRLLKSLNESIYDLAVLKENEQALKICKQILGVQCLLPCATFADVKQKVESAYAEFQDNYLSLKSKVTQLMAHAKDRPRNADIDDLCQSAYALSNRVENCRFNLDMMCDFSVHMKGKIEKMNKGLEVCAATPRLA